MCPQCLQPEGVKQAKIMYVGCSLGLWVAEGVFRRRFCLVLQTHPAGAGLISLSSLVPEPGMERPARIGLEEEGVIGG